MAKKNEQNPTKMAKIYTQLSAFEMPRNYEQNTESSLTIPDQTMSVQEMIRRHRQGLPISGNRQQPIYREGDEPIKNLDHMDLVDRQAYIDSVADALVDIKARLEANAKTQKDKEFLARVDYEVKKKLTELRQNGGKDITDIQEEP